MYLGHSQTIIDERCNQALRLRTDAGCWVSVVHRAIVAVFIGRPAVDYRLDGLMRQERIFLKDRMSVGRVEMTVVSEIFGRCRECAAWDAKPAGVRRSQLPRRLGKVCHSRG